MNRHTNREHIKMPSFRANSAPAPTADATCGNALGGFAACGPECDGRRHAVAPLVMIVVVVVVVVDVVAAEDVVFVEGCMPP